MNEKPANTDLRPSISKTISIKNAIAKHLNIHEWIEYLYAYFIFDNNNDIFSFIFLPSHIVMICRNNFLLFTQNMILGYKLLLITNYKSIIAKQF